MPTARSKSLLTVFRELKDSEEKDLIAAAMSRDEWIGELTALMKEIRRWLRPVESEALAQVEATEIELTDGPFGAYAAPALRITAAGGRVVWVRPAGVLSVGAKGWVDVVCGPHRAMLVLNRRNVWKLRGMGEPARAPKLEPLDEARFAEVLAELVA